MTDVRVHQCGREAKRNEHMADMLEGNDGKLSRMGKLFLFFSLLFVLYSGKDTTSLNIQIVIELQKVVNLVECHPRVMLGQFLGQVFASLHNHISVLFTEKASPFFTL